MGRGGARKQTKGRKRKRRTKGREEVRNATKDENETKAVLKWQRDKKPLSEKTVRYGVIYIYRRFGTQEGILIRNSHTSLCGEFRRKERAPV